MDSVQVKRRLVKSPPELWAELSDAQALSRRLGEFGEIRITRREPETIVAWEGEHASGTIEIESSGWGTAVIITARPAVPPSPEPAAEVPGPTAPPAPDPAPPAPGPDPAPPPAPDPEPPSPGPPSPGPPPAPDPGPQIEAEPPRATFLSRLFRRATEPAVQAVPGPPADPAEPAPEPTPPAAPPAPAVEPEPDPGPEVEPEPAPPGPEPLRPAQPDDPLTPAASIDAQKVLDAVLDDLGAAHHRPFSRG